MSSTHIATLIVNSATPFLRDRHVRRAAEVLSSAAAPRWLADGVAVDLPFAPSPDADNRQIADIVRGALAGEPIDVVVQRAAGRRKRLLVADMDSTLIEQECIDELADAVGLRTKVAAITDRSMRGEIAFEPALRERVTLLAGLDLETVHRIFAERVTYTPGARTLVQTMRAQGATAAIVSGGFTLLTARVAAALGFDWHFANTLVVVGDHLTGALEDPVLGREAKCRVLCDLRAAQGLQAEDTLAVGDGANDLAMLAEAGLGVAFRAKPAVAAAAAARIVYGDLTALLFMQGYAQTAFVG